MKYIFIILAAWLLFGFFYGYVQGIKRNKRLNLQGLERIDAYRKSSRALIAFVSENQGHGWTDDEIYKRAMYYYLDGIRTSHEFIETMTLNAMKQKDQKEAVRLVCEAIICSFVLDKNTGLQNLYDIKNDSKVFDKVFNEEYDFAIENGVIYSVNGNPR